MDTTENGDEEDGMHIGAAAKVGREVAFSAMPIEIEKDITKDEVEDEDEDDESESCLPCCNRLNKFTKKLIHSSMYYVVPIIVVIEVAITLPSTNVNPDHPLHLVSFCANCNIIADTVLSTLSDHEVECISDGILSEIGDMMRDYFLNYIGSMVGHILIIYALIQSKDSDFISNNKETAQKSKRLHQIAYGILFADIVTEIVALESLQVLDPSSFTKSLEDGTYTSCDDSNIDEVDIIKADLTYVAFVILVFRVCVAIICSVLYVYIPLVQVKEEVKAKEKTEDPGRGGLLMRLASFKSFRM